MVSLTPAFEGFVVGFFAAMLLLLICSVVIQRRLKSRKKCPEAGCKRIHSDNRTQAIIEKPLLGKEKLPFSTPVSTQPPLTVTWAEPLTQYQPKPRSVSCPTRDSTTALSEPAQRSQENKVESPERKRKKNTRRRRAQTVGCYHVCQIQFSIQYNFYHSKLFLKLVCAINIPSTFGVTYGSFLEVELLPNLVRASTRIQFHTNNPVYDETFEFSGYSYDELLNKSLKFRLFTIDRFSRSSLTGQVLFPIVELEINQTKPTIVWRPIASIDNQFKNSSTTQSEESSDRGELYISLKYQILSNKVTVVVMKALNLPQVNKILPIDPYVIVKLLLNHQTVQTKKTNCKRRTSCPCWNEPLVFEIDEKIPISEYSLSFKVKSRNNLSEDPTLGEFEIGYQAEGSGKEHWKDMITKKNQDRAMRHKIK